MKTIAIIGKLICFMLLALWMLGCARQPIYVSKTDTIRNIQTIYQTRDSLIKLPADSSWIEQYIRCYDENGKLTADKAQLMQIINFRQGQRVNIPHNTIQDNVLRTECKVDTGAVIAKIKDRIISDYLQLNKTIVPPPVKYVPKFIKFLAWSGGIAWGLIVILLVALILKTWTKLQIPFLK